jgi:hypothetical protein
MRRYKVSIIPAAFQDMQQARRWYHSKSHQLPSRFTNDVKQVLERIRSAPGVHAVRYKEVRIANLPVFPYAIHYIIEADTVVVLAVHHTAINPNRWDERL